MPKMRDLCSTQGNEGAIAQLGERNAGSVEVIGSIPISSTKQKKGHAKA